MKHLAPLDAATYVPSPLHGEDRIWTETNCYADLWIELLHALGLDPVAGLAFTLSADFEGDQFQFFKYPAEDLRALFGIEISEMNPWRALPEHIAEQLVADRLLTIEVDSFYLPDTAGVSYGIEHVKTTIAPAVIDVDARRLGYFHGPGYFTLDGEDYAGALRLDADDAALPPYVELVRFERLERPDAGELHRRTLTQVISHLARRPSSNPVRRFAERFASDLEWLQTQDLAMFHTYAFVSMRQLGACSELAGTLCGWLAEHGETTGVAAEQFGDLAAAAKTVQFKLARLAMGRSGDVGELLGGMERTWQQAMDEVDRALEGSRVG